MSITFNYKYFYFTKIQNFRESEFSFYYVMNLEGQRY